MKLSKRKSLQAGFTMFELVAVMLIVGIIAWIGTSSFGFVTGSNRISAEINALNSDLRFARTEAIKEGLFVTVCASSNGTTCSTTSAWQNGWIVISDPTGTQTPNGAPLHVQPAFSNAFNNSTDTITVNGGFWAVTFNRQGFGSNIVSPGTTALLKLHNTPVEKTVWTRCLQISPIGLLAIQQAGTGSCT
jgi:type IV fimbrial biogenesis protein FimT